MDKSDTQKPDRGNNRPLSDALRTQRRSIRKLEKEASALRTKMHKYERLAYVAKKPLDNTTWQYPHWQSKVQLSEVTSLLKESRHKLLLMEWIGPWIGYSLGQKIDRANYFEQKLALASENEGKDVTSASSLLGINELTAIDVALSECLYSEIPARRAVVLSRFKLLPLKLQLFALDRIMRKSARAYITSLSYSSQLEARVKDYDQIIEALYLELDNNEFSGEITLRLIPAALAHVSHLQNLIRTVQFNQQEFKNTLEAVRKKRVELVVEKVILRDLQKVNPQSIIEKMETKINQREVEIAGSIDSQREKREQKLYQAFTIVIETATAALTEFKTQIDSHEPEPKIESIEVALEKLLESKEDHSSLLRNLRRKYQSSIVREQVQVLESLATEISKQCLSTFRRLEQSLTLQVANSIIQIETASADNRERLSNDTREILLQILKHLGFILDCEISVREDLRYWASMDSFAKYDQNDPDALFVESFAQEAKASCETSLAGWLEIKAMYQTMRNKLETVLIAAGLYENYQDKLLERRNYWPAIVTEPVDASDLLARVEKPLNRAAGLLKKLESLLDMEGGTSEENSELIKFTNREQCRAVLTDLIETEKELRARSRALAQEQHDKMWLWQKRVLVAEKVGDAYLAIRAGKRKQIHETALAFLERRDATAPATAPAVFKDILDLVLRVESKCGLKANTAMNEDSLLLFSLLDRILFLIESLLPLV